MIKNGVHSLHQIPLNVMKRHTLGGTMVDAPLDINAKKRVPTDPIQTLVG
jgi:hypothetical protein